MPSPIIIYGTGRCGSTLLYRMMAAHAGVHAFPYELRFLSDPDGLTSLLDALTTRYSPWGARVALRRSYRLMISRLTDLGARPYARRRLDSLFPPGEYFGRIATLMQRVIEAPEDAAGFTGSHYTGVGGGWDVPGGWLPRGAHLLRVLLRARLDPGLRKRPMPVGMAKYFGDRAEAAALLGGFAHELFMTSARAAGRQTWCEKTPHHMAHVGVLGELFPQARFIHMVRDPRAVAASMLATKWFGTDMRLVCTALCQLYDAHDAQMKADPALAARVLTVRLEDLAADVPGVLAKVSAHCGLERTGFGELPEIDAARATARATQGGSAESSTQSALAALGTWRTRYGYR